jgi:hypothetical protein
MGTAAAASCLPNQTEHVPEQGEPVDSKVLWKGAYSANQRSAVRWMGGHTPNQWSDGASLTIVLLLSLGVWAAIWQAIAFLG